MKLSNAFALFTDLSAAIRVALFPTVKDVYRNPSNILHLSRMFMGHVWAAFAGPTDENGRPVKRALLLPHVKGVVLDLGAAFGHSIQYFDCSKITKYVAVEPNIRMHAGLRETANTAGFHESDGSLVILSCGAGDTLRIVEALGSPHPVDTITSILTICSIPEPKHAITSLVRDVLKPGGQILFYEHVLSPRTDVAWWQHFWAPLWSLFMDGCRLDCPAHLLISDMKDVDGSGQEVGMWAEGKSWGKPKEDEENLWWHQAGRYVKHF